jgi:hypothetical protein
MNFKRDEGVKKTLATIKEKQKKKKKLWEEGVKARKNVLRK